MPRARLALLLLLLAPAARPDGPPPPAGAEAPGQAPDRLLAAWLRAGPWLADPVAVGEAQGRAAVGLGMALRPLPWLSLALEGSWISRDLAGLAAASSLESRALTAGVRLQRTIGRLEPWAFGGVSWLRSVLTLPGAGGGTGSEGAAATGLGAGAGLDVELGSGLALGLDWRWLRATATFPRLAGGPVALGGHALCAAARVYWP